MSRIVHADNSEFFRKLMKTFLMELGHESESFARGEAVVDEVKEVNIDIVITGMSLADMSGEELIKRLAVSAQALPVIVVTSSDEVKQHKRLEALGVKAVIQKSGDWKSELAQQLAD